jgi:hypothetical protein
VSETAFLFASKTVRIPLRQGDGKQAGDSQKDLATEAVFSSCRKDFGLTQFSGSQVFTTFLFSRYIQVHLSEEGHSVSQQLVIEHLL